jgi:Glycosyl hydrolases family 2, TIM barrel domain/Glycosyl hydrolases family 2, sugar binding domain/Glycosyl hydrolases family 2
MPRPRVALLAVLAAVLIGAAPASAASTVSTPSKKTLYRNGDDGRYLMDGTWLFRLDPPGGGLAAGLQKSASTAGWAPITVPYTWNAHDDSVASYTGGVGWYRKDFRLPDAHSGLDWIVRFESVNYRAQVWLNGHPLGSFAGEFLPYELVAKGIKRHGVNRLVVRIDSRHKDTDFPPFRVTDEGAPTGGWWNEGGLNREVYLRRVDKVDLTSQVVRPILPCPRCAASVDFQTNVKSFAAHATQVKLRATFGSRSKSLGTHTVPANGSITVSGRLSIGHPKLWFPGKPNLYKATITATARGGGGSRYVDYSGVRSIKVNRSGQFLINGEVAHWRGVGMHEDVPATGWALTPDDERQLIAEVQSTGATIIRAHYPLNPYIEELADEKGILLWSEIPVYGLTTDAINTASVRAAAVKLLQANITTNQNHPSIAVWSIANELSSHVNHGQTAYTRAAVQAAHKLDPTRPVGQVVAGYYGVPCQAGYRPLDVIGFNDYFGWYTGAAGQIADEDLLSTYLDGIHACYPHQALVMTEFGAEGNRNGPAEEKGTYAFQNNFAAFHLGVFATKPWLTGAIWWALREFRVRPAWDGGNPRPDPPIHEKGLYTFAGQPKPVLATIQQSYKSSTQYGPAR